MPGVIILNPAAVFLDPNQQAVQSNATLTASGSQILTGYGVTEVSLFINITATPTGTAPTLQFTIQEVDPGDGTTLIGSSVSSTVINSIGIQRITLTSSFGGSIKVSWVIGGTTPSFTGVYATLVGKSGNVKLVDSTGAAIGPSNPLRVDGTGTTTQPVSGTVTVTQATAASLNATVVGVGTAGTPSGGVVSIQGVSGGQAIPVSGTVTATNPSVGSNNAAIPTSSTQVGGSDGTNLQAARVFDADSGAGTQYVLGTVLRKSASGGSVEAGTSSDPLRTDPTGTTTQPVSGTVTANIGTTNGLALDATLTGGTQRTKVTDGTNNAAVKAASTAAIATDPALVVAVSPNNSVAITAASLPLPTGASTAANQTTLGNQTTKINDGTNTATVKAASTAAVASDTAIVVAISPNNPIVASNPSVSATGSAPPAQATSVGGSVTTAAPSYTTGQLNSLSLNTAGGLRVDGSGVTQPVSAASLPLPTGAATETTLAAINTKTLAAGQAVMASSSPVVIASNQTAIPITDNAGSLTVDGTVTANQGTAAALAGRWPVIVTDGTNTMPTGDAVGRAVFEKITDGTNTAAVKAASTAPVAADPALVIAVSPNSLPLSTQLSGFRYSSTIPDPSNYATTNQTPTAFDKQGRLEVHATITGDKGAFREEFTGTALANAMSGTLTFTNGLATVTGSGTGFTGLAKGQWVKKTADAEAQYGQIFSVGNDTTLTLTAPYTGTTGASTGVISNWQTVTATGGSIVVATSLATLASGVTSGQSTYLRRDVGSGPYTFQHIFSISQRIANQTIFAGPADNPTTPGLRARVEFTGTNNTQCTLVTSAGLLAGDVQSTTVSLPNSGTTATAHNYRIEQSGSRVSLVVDNIRLVTHDTHLPDPYAMLQWHIGITNTGVPASSTNVVVDVCYSASYERTQIDNDFSGEALSIQGPDATGLVTSSNPVLGGGIDQNGLLRTVALDANGVTRVVTPARQRVSITFQAVAPAVADTLLTLVKSTNGTAAAGATTQPVAASKILRLTSMTFSLRAGAAAAAFATFNLRINAAGAAVIGSPSEFRVDLGNTEAVIGAARSITIPLVNGFELSGTQQLAVSAAAQAVTNILSVTLSGYEYAI